MRVLVLIAAAHLFAAHPTAVQQQHVSLRAYAGPCLAAIIDVEDPSWDPGRWNSQGSGAFGLGQALPYSKMPRRAWPKKYGGREDPYVQIGWMRIYTRRWGGPCGALAQERAHGWY